MLLGFLFIFPFLLSLLLFIKPKLESVKYIALGGALLELALTLPLLFMYADGSSGCILFHPDIFHWFGFNFILKLDGLALLMVLLTNVLTPLIILSSFSKKHDGSFYALILLMQMALIGVFSAADVLLFYIFWELALIPIYFISALWGGENRVAITIKFFLYTMVGSLFMLVAILYLYTLSPEGHSFAFDSYYKIALPLSAQGLIFLAFFLAFAIKIPIFPFHTWQPETYTVAPTQGSMLLAAIMGKMGLFGLIKFILPLCPNFLEIYGVYFIGLALIGLIYASIIAINQKDFKMLIAYSSMAHVGLISVAILTKNQYALQGAIFQMVAHGVNVVALFYCYHIIYSRTGTSIIKNLGGIATKAPIFAIFFIIIVLANIALPLTNGFVGEFLMLLGIYQYNPFIAFLAGTSIIFGAVYMLWATQRIMYGDISEATKEFEDITKVERVMLLTFSIMIFVFGIYPKALLGLIEGFVKTII